MNIMEIYKEEIEFLNKCVRQSMMSYIYSKFIMNFERRVYPVKIIMIPSIKSVSHYLNNINYSNIIENIPKNELYKKYLKNNKDLFMLTELIEKYLVYVFMYFKKDIDNVIPIALSRRFQVGEFCSNQHYMVEHPDIKVFLNSKNTEKYFRDDYLINEIILSIIMLSDKFESYRKTNKIENNEFSMKSNEILTISNESAMCPIYFNYDIISNNNIMEILSFVTCTKFITHKNFDINNESIKMITSPSNEIHITNINNFG